MCINKILKRKILSRLISNDSESDEDEWSENDKDIYLEEYQRTSGVHIIPKNKESVLDVMQLFLGNDLFELFTTETNRLFVTSKIGVSVLDAVKCKNEYKDCCQLMSNGSSLQSLSTCSNAFPIFDDKEIVRNSSWVMLLGSFLFIIVASDSDDKRQKDLAKLYNQN
uniref:PiggyBac transposable element-derived protein domain-containing protein n=1 Tax=Glossina austeni TaxID=7395 RepID=A0A1A9VAU7_GLOAU